MDTGPRPLAPSGIRSGRIETIPTGMDIFHEDDPTCSVADILWRSCRFWVRTVMISQPLGAVTGASQSRDEIDDSFIRMKG